MSTTPTRPAPVPVNIPAKEITRYPANRMPDEESIKKMAESIKEHGILQPVTVRKIESEIDSNVTSYQLIFGETRWKGAMRVKPNYAVPAIVLECDDKQAARLHAVENFQRKDLDEIEEAQAMANMLDTGWTVIEIAESIGRVRDTVYLRLQLLKLPEAARDAVREKNLTMNTANKLLSLPQALQADALEEIIRPSHAAKPLSERDAIAMLDRDYILPMKQEQEWNEKRKLAESENPDATWLEYAEAAKCRRWDSGYVEADEYPAHNLLSAAALADELVVPTWDDLARRHGATVYLGSDYDGKITRFVQPEPIIAAERAACDGSPGDCIFEHAGAAAEAAQARERRRMEAAAEAAAIEAEKKAVYEVLCDAVTPLTKTAAKKAAIALLARLEDQGYTDNLLEVFGLVAESDRALAEADAMGKAVALLGNKNAEPLVTLARLMMAVGLSTVFHAGEFGAFALETGLIKRARVPLLSAAADALSEAQAAAAAAAKQRAEEEVLNG